MSLLSGALTLDTTSIIVGIVTAVLLFSVFFKGISDFVEEVGHLLKLSFLSSGRHQIGSRGSTKIFLWVGLSIAMAYASSAFLDPFPTKIDFQGTTFSDRTNSKDSSNADINILSYRNKDNSKVLVIASVNDSDTTITDFRQRYIKNLESQGVKFKHQGNRFIGSTTKEQVYLTENYMMGALLIYTEQAAGALPKFSDNKSKFIALEDLEY
jgi:hypothetical protein